MENMASSNRSPSVDSKNAVQPGEDRMDPGVGSSGCGGRSGAGRRNSDQVEEEEEQDDDSSSSSSSSSLHQHSSSNVEEALNSFRKAWKRELEYSPQRAVPSTSVREYRREEKGNERDDQTIEDRARHLFLQGVHHEQIGKLYEAIQFYRRAVQLVPDIEFRTYNGPKPRTRVRKGSGSSQGTLSETDLTNNNGTDDEKEFEKVDLVSRFQRLFFCNLPLCDSAKEVKSTHISALPKEVILYILKWVVSADLDLRSLEMVSLVSRGFYLCSRDSELWRLSCMRVWGTNCSPFPMYSSWRDMFIERPRLRFNGCYISKTTYVRPGENSFQDQFYRPWHLVEYFRYLRFFPEGLVLMLTTPDEPVMTVGHLRTRSTRHSAVLAGHYCIHGNTVTAVLQRKIDRSSNRGAINNKFRRRRDNIHQDPGEQTFHVGFEIRAFRHHPHWQLTWHHYAIYTKYRNGQESSSTFDLGNTKFPPFWFSRVRSYTAESESPLE